MAKAVGTSPPVHTPVFLNVYSMEPITTYVTSWFGFGVYHSGGGHQSKKTGIFQMRPKDPKALARINDKFVFKESIFIGYTDMTLKEINDLIIKLGDDWKGIQYHILLNNCNTFSNHFCTLLCHNGIPEWVNKGADLLANFAFLEEYFPAEFRTTPNLQAKKNKVPKVKGKGQQSKFTSISQLKKK